MIRSQKGFSTIEALLAMGTFAIAMLGISSLPVTALHANIHARKVTAATNLARDKVEELRSDDYANLASGSDPGPLNEGGETTGDNVIFTRSWTVAAGPQTGTKEITVKTTWTDASTHVVTLQTVIAEGLG